MFGLGDKRGITPGTKNIFALAIFLRFVSSMGFTVANNPGSGLRFQGYDIETFFMHQSLF